VHTVVRPKIDRAWRARLPLFVLALGFAATQFYLARLTTTKATLAASLIGFGAAVLIIGYALFLSRANVTISGAEVVVHDWLGRQRFRSKRNGVNFRLVSVRDMGIPEEFGVLWAKQETGDISAVLVRRVPWGDSAFSSLRAHIHGRNGELNFRPVSKRALAQEFPQLHVQNLPAIAVVVLVIVLLAIVVSRQ
jgi:hypothetical protein